MCNPPQPGDESYEVFIKVWFWLFYVLVFADLQFEKCVKAYFYNPFHFWSVARFVNKKSREHIYPITALRRSDQLRAERKQINECERDEGPDREEWPNFGQKNILNYKENKAAE